MCNYSKASDICPVAGDLQAEMPSNHPVSKAAELQHHGPTCCLVGSILSR
jgi:hypothetical protein